MRALILGFLASALVCGAAFATALDNVSPTAPSPFPVQRGTALMNGTWLSKLAALRRWPPSKRAAARGDNHEVFCNRTDVGAPCVSVRDDVGRWQCNRWRGECGRRARSRRLAPGDRRGYA